MTKQQKYPTDAIFLKSWWFKEIIIPSVSDPRYTVDFCTVPRGLFFTLSKSQLPEVVVGKAEKSLHTYKWTSFPQALTFPSTKVFQLHKFLTFEKIVFFSL